MNDVIKWTNPDINFSYEPYITKIACTREDSPLNILANINK